MAPLGNLLVVDLPEHRLYLVELRRIRREEAEKTPRSRSGLALTKADDNRSLTADCQSR
jgi:hypothetical protein